MIATNRAASSLDIVPLDASFGAEVRGLNFAQAIDAQAFDEIYAAFLRYQLLLFRDQDVSQARQVELARLFGEVQIHVMNQYHTSTHPEIYYLSNLDASGAPNGIHPDRGTLHWHTDGSWRARTGHATIMYAEIVPGVGGDTLFCDMYGAYDVIDASTKRRLRGLKAVHNLDFSRARRHGEDPMTDAQRREVPPVAHPIIRTHPETGRKCMFLGDHAEYITDLSYREGRALVERLNAEIVRPQTVYRHRYQPRDLIVWDNRCLLHRATTYDAAGERRVMRRCTCVGDRPFA